MMIVSPVISRKATIWRAWVGFNASHSFGAISLWRAVPLPRICHSAFLFQSSGYQLIASRAKEEVAPHLYEGP
jgi:hypothetical protein